MLVTKPRPPKLLLVEGLSDKWAMRGIHRKFCSDLRFGIEEKRGLPSLIRSIQPECKVEDRDALGLIVDADQDLEAVWAQIGDTLSKIGIVTPDHPDPDGTLIETESEVAVAHRVGIWVMPDNRQSGGMEDFLIYGIKKSDILWKISEEFIDNIPQKIREFDDRHVSKAKLHAWLSTKKLPGRLESAIKSGSLDVDLDPLEQFICWLNDLFA